MVRGLALSKVPGLAEDIGCHYGLPSKEAPTSFVVDCRLFRVTAEAAETARRSLGKDKILPLPSSPPAKPPAPPPEIPEAKPKSGFGKLMSVAKGAASAVGGALKTLGIANPLPGGEEGGGRSDPDFARQCAELYGLFARKKVMLAPSDALLKRSFGKPKPVANLEDAEAKDGIFVAHMATSQWYKCFIVGQANEASLQCALYKPQAGSQSMCGIHKCDYDRQTFKTECLVRMPAGKPECLYVGQGGEMHGKDIMGKTVGYSVYLLQGPPPLPVEEHLLLRNASTEQLQRRQLASDFLRTP
eukprot:TRINITY_DN9236_c0_g1_i1.p1 TRINITY_DN9236_c0_g1~~TRINITY_DN9236_c0_g1_i1.p1  ORF type:complete len:301 (+),score=43.06 TRINITY_DN9236_c0_g1_i1:115-1017(+)